MSISQAGASPRLSDEEQQMLHGGHGPALAMAMDLIVRLARAAGAEQLIEISAAHIDGCLYHGTVGLDFAERLADGAGRVRVPTTLNVSALDLLHPDLVQLDEETRRRARRLMDAYVEMGCQPTWTCAPYLLPSRPALGQHIAWAESNAIVFANSVIGARTDRYGDFIDICAALTGRVPDAGLHRSENRRADIVFRLEGVDQAALGSDEIYGLIGHIVGQEAGGGVPALLGLPHDVTEDQLKALGAAAASSGSVAMFHVVGVTPEAPTLAAALAGDVAGALDGEAGPSRPPPREVMITTARLRRAWEELSTSDGYAGLAAVSLGTPHFSLAEFAMLEAALAGRRINPAIETYVSTGRDTLARLTEAGTADLLAGAGLKIVVDTCTYVTPILRAAAGTTVMTNSAKWAWYAPANLGVEVVFGSLADCVESAVSGRVVRERPAYLDG